MKKLSLLALALTFLCLAPQVGQAQSRRTVRKTYKPYVTPPADIDTRWASSHSPWDFSGVIGIYNPGFGLGGRVAYRIVDNIVSDVDDSLSLEFGLGWVGASNTYGGTSVSYSLIELPAMGRWDFRLRNTNFIVGPQLGLSYLAGSSVTGGNNQTYSTPGGSIYLELGGFGIYRFSEKWGARADLKVGGYFSFTFGATYFL
jgi:hypothetical protein